MATVVLGLLCVLVVVAGAPHKTYDQRQQGELNIHAQLDNIVILLIPTSGLNLLELAGKTRFAGQKGSLLQIFQKPVKDIDRYETVKDEETAQNDIKTELFVPALASQQVDLKRKGDDEKEEEVVATVEEMKPVTTEKPIIDAPSSEATEDNPIKEHSTISETVQESVLKVSMPEGMKDAEEAEKEEPQEPATEVNFDIVSVNPTVESVKTTETSPKEDVIPTEENKEGDSLKSVVTPTKEEPSPTKSDEHSQIKEPATVYSDSPDLHHDEPNPSVKDFIRPVAAKEDPVTVAKKTSSPEEPAAKTSVKPVKQEGTRKDRVIRYKPDTKWAPGLVDLIGPPKPKARELEERHRYAGLCAPGVWDTELKTCIMPGETRSRNELARFLEAMRFGIAVPNQ